MQIHTFRDDEQGSPGGYEKRSSVSLRLTPYEARNLRVALDDFLSEEAAWTESWHYHVRAWDKSCEIVVLPDFEGAAREPSHEDRVEEHLRYLADQRASVVRAVRGLVELEGVSEEEAKKRLREHPLWRDRFES